MISLVVNFLIFLFAYRFIRYITTPILKHSGYYKYYSPMFFTVPLFYRVLEIHIGTSWDFFKLKSANPTTIFSYLVEGLFKLAEDIESNKVHPETKIRGFIYYLNESTVKKFGFTTRKPNFFEWILFSLNYLELCILQSISYKRISIVKLDNIQIITISGKELVSYKPVFKTAYEKFQRRYAIKPIITSVTTDNERLHEVA